MEGMFFYKLIFNCINMASNSEFVKQILFTHSAWLVPCYKLWFLLMISGVPCLRVNSFDHRLVFYSVVCSLLLMSLYPRASKNPIFDFEYLKSNFIVLCFWYTVVR